MRVRVCVSLPGGFYQLVSNVSVDAEDPLIMLLSLLFSGAIKDTSGYQEAALGGLAGIKYTLWPHSE